MRGWRYRRHCREPERYLAWLAQIARHEALRLRARPHPTEELEDTAATISDEYVDTVLTKLVIGDALRELDPQERSLLHLRYGVDLTYQEVADRLGMPVGTAKVRLHRLRARLRARLAEVPWLASATSDQTSS
jgi:RNA polymerase sigma-70 factor (ECF subfamily)